jgi:hypothetical protein
MTTLTTLKMLRLAVAAVALAVSALAVSAFATGPAAHAGTDECEEESYCIRLGAGGDSEISVSINPDRSRYRVGEEIDICARAERSGTVTFTNRKNGRVRDLPVSLQLGAGREFCFNGEIERGDECVGAKLRAGGRTSTAEEVCFAVRG